MNYANESGTSENDLCNVEESIVNLKAKRIRIQYIYTEKET
jgi:hypothetical protein